MEILGLLAGIFLALLITIIFFQSTYSNQRDGLYEEPVGLVRRLACSLNGDPDHDESVQRRILALGADGIPDLLLELNRSLNDCAIEDAARISHLEEVIADFGLVGLPTVARQLERVPAGTPLVPPLLRIIERLGQPGANSVVRYGLANPRFLPFLPRFAGTLPAKQLANRLANGDSEQLEIDLTALATTVSKRPEVIDYLWHSVGPRRRCAILNWLSLWLPVCRPEDVLRGLEDDNAAVRVGAAKLARLLVDPCLIEPLSRLLADTAECQTAAVEALRAQNLEQASPALEEALESCVYSAALEALIGLLRSPRQQSKVNWKASLHLVECLGRLFPGFDDDDLTQLDVTRLAAVLDGTAGRERALVLHLLAVKAAGDPRAREKLIFLAGGGDEQDRVIAVSALAQAGDTTSADLLVNVACSMESSDHLTTLQETAQHIGPEIVPRLARRLRPSAGKRTTDIIAILRSLDYGGALPSLLLAMDDVRDPLLESHMTSTCYIGNRGPSESLESAIKMTERGLLMPSLRYLMVHGSPEDLPNMLNIYDQHPSLRGLVSCLIEMQGRDAITALRERIDRGGDDLLLLTLECRLAILEASYSES